MKIYVCWKMRRARCWPLTFRGALFWCFHATLSSLMMVILHFHPSIRIRGRYGVDIAVWCYMHCPLELCCWGSTSLIKLWWMREVVCLPFAACMDLCEWGRWLMFFPYAFNDDAALWMQSMLELPRICGPCWSRSPRICGPWWSRSAWCNAIVRCLNNQVWQCVHKGWSTRTGDASGIIDQHRNWPD